MEAMKERAVIVHRGGGGGGEKEQVYCSRNLTTMNGCQKQSRVLCRGKGRGAAMPEPSSYNKELFYCEKELVKRKMQQMTSPPFFCGVSGRNTLTSFLGNNARKQYSLRCHYRVMISFRSQVLKDIFGSILETLKSDGQNFDSI